MKRRALMIACLIVGPVALLAPRNSAFAQTIRFFPIRLAPLGSPPGTVGFPVTPEFNSDLGCWELRVQPGVEVDIDVQAFGWGNADGSSTLSVVQAVVISAGYDNGFGAPLSPKGWPDSPTHGAYQATHRCEALGGDLSPCVPPFDLTCDNLKNGVCVEASNWVMPRCTLSFAVFAANVLDYNWGTAVQVNCNINQGTCSGTGDPCMVGAVPSECPVVESCDSDVKTFGGLILEVPANAAGTYVIAFNPNPNYTGMLSDSETLIPDVVLTSACITIVTVGPPIAAPTPHDILKNRYISIDPRGLLGNNPPSHHIRVTLVSSLVIGQAGNGPWWAAQPDAACISVVTEAKPALEPDWTGCNTAHLTGCPIIPTTTYALAAESGGTLSADALFGTQAKPGAKWHGDCVGFFTGTEWTAPNGETNINDVFAAILTFSNPNAILGCGAPPCNATHVSVTDMEPNLTPGPPNNQVVGIADVFSIILGFQGTQYPGPDLTQCP